MSSNRAYEGDWTLVAMNDPAGRRGIWYRQPDETTLEVCAGREGDDEYLRVAVGDTVTLSVMLSLLGVMTRCVGGPTCGGQKGSR